MPVVLAMFGNPSEIGVLILALILIPLVCFCKLASRIGYPWAIGLLALVPFVGFILLIFFAFGEWPIERRAAGSTLTR